jgi:hypothetical protein
MNSWVLYDTFASLENDMDHTHVSYRYRIMILLLENDLVHLVHVSFLGCPSLCPYSS